MKMESAHRISFSLRAALLAKTILELTTAQDTVLASMIIGQCRRELDIIQQDLDNLKVKKP